MPLPSTNMAWPPTSLAPVSSRHAEWSAWYSGAPEELATVYGSMLGAGFDSTSRQRVADHPSQFRGGLVGWVARKFWGEPLNWNQPQARLHVPLAADIATASADLLFAEPPAITLPDGSKDKATAARLAELADDQMMATFVEAADTGAGLGGTYLRVCWDTSIADRPWLTSQQADAAVPEWRWGQLTAVTFWRVIEIDGDTVIRHLERHEPGYILNGVYKGTADKLGKPADLGGWSETQDLEPVIDTGLTKLTAAYIPNMRPNKIWRNVPAASPLGRADIGGSEGLLDALDETWSSWMRDIRLGKGRLIAPDTMLESLGPGKGARFDAEREVWQGLNMLDTGGAGGITVAQFAIRVAEHKDTATEQIDAILRAAGYSAQTLGIENQQHGRAAVTATEINARERRSLITRDKKIKYWRPGVSDILETLLMVDQAVFKSGVTPVKPVITFGESVQEDMTSLAQTAQLLRAAEAASTETLVQMIHPDWEKEQVQAEVAKIQAEAPQAPPGPDQLGMEGDAGPGGQDHSGSGGY